MTVLQLAASLSLLSAFLAFLAIWALAKGRISSPRLIVLAIAGTCLPAILALCLILIRHIALADKA